MSVFPACIHFWGVARVGFPGQVLAQLESYRATPLTRELSPRRYQVGSYTPLRTHATPEVSWRRPPPTDGIVPRRVGRWGLRAQPWAHARVWTLGSRQERLPQCSHMLALPGSALRVPLVYVRSISGYRDPPVS